MNDSITVVKLDDEQAADQLVTADASVPFYVPAANWLRQRSPFAFAILRGVKRTLQSALRYWPLSLAGAALLIGLVALAAVTPNVLLKIILVSAASALAVGGLVLFIAIRARSNIQKLSNELQAERLSIAGQQSELHALLNSVSAALNAEQERVAHVFERLDQADSRIGGLSGHLDHAVEIQHKAVEISLAETAARLRAQIGDAVERGIGRDSSARESFDLLSKSITADVTKLSENFDRLNEKVKQSTETQNVTTAAARSKALQAQSIADDVASTLQRVRADYQDLRQKVTDRSVEQQLSKRLDDVEQELAQRASLKVEIERLHARLGDIALRIQGTEAEVSELTKIEPDALARIKESLRLSLVEAEQSRLALQTMSEDMQSLKNSPSGTDVVLAMRYLRHRWIAPERALIPPHVNSSEHGHELLMYLLTKLDHEKPGSLLGKSLIEVGTMREPVIGQRSTLKLGLFAHLMGMDFVTVDMDPKNTERARLALAPVNPEALAINQKGEEYLATHIGPLEYVYLDAFDFDHDNHSDERRARYKEVLNTDITNEACWKMHLECARVIQAKMTVGGIVVIDDTWLDDAGELQGKGRLAVPYLKGRGFEEFAVHGEAIALKRID